MTSRMVAVVFSFAIVACVDTEPPVEPKLQGLQGCNETCSSTTQCGSWCSTCATGSLGSLNGRCQHALPLLPGEEATWYELP